ncbi:MAG: extracellular solute-binding protein [Caldilineaceae bacterium]|nr:extracellular solute-binding protein [Caldilineaceae bacterium]
MSQARVSRRQFLRLTGGTVGMMALAACAPVAAPVAAPAGDTAASAGITVAADTPLWVLQNQDFHPDYNEFVRRHIEEFAAEKGYALEVADVAGFVAGGAEMQKIAAQVAADDSPDLLQRSGNVFQWKQLDLITSASDVVNEVIAKHGDTGERQKKDLMIDGEWYAVPFHVRSDGGWALKSVWDNAGIDITAIRTFDEYREASLEVSDPAQEMWGFGITVNRSGDGNYMMARVLHSFGAFWTDETGQYVTIDSPEAVAAVEWVVETYTDPKWDRILPPGVLSWTDPTNNEAFLAGKLAYTMNGGTLYARAIVDQVPFVDDIIWDYPKGGPGLLNFFGLGSMNFLKIRGGKNPEATNELLLSFFEDEAMKEVYTVATTYALPAYTNMWEWDEITSVPNSLAQKEGALDPAGWNGIAYPGPGTPWIGAVETQNLTTDMVAAAITGQATPAEAVRQAAEASVRIFQEMGAAGER